MLLDSADGRSHLKQYYEAYLAIARQHGLGFVLDSPTRRANPADLGRRYVALRRAFPRMRLLGGCCGTDHRHVAAICEACAPFQAAGV